MYKQFIWGNRNLTVNGKCLYSRAFIDARYLKVEDILQINGKIRENIFDRLEHKQSYLTTMSKIQQSLKQYKQIRFSYGKMHNNDVDMVDTTTLEKKKCKWFYKHIVKQKAKQATAITKWSDILHSEINWGDVYQRKIRHQFQTKLSEFNYKLLNNILPTGCNLLRWRKSESSNCIYCNYINHDTKHLLWDCQHCKDIWKIISDLSTYNVTWKTITIGDEDKQLPDKALSLLCYIIYKKYITDRENIQHRQTGLQLFIKSEINSRLKIYTENVCKQESRIFLTEVSNALHI